MARDFWVKVGDRIVGDVCEFALRRGSRQIVWLEMFVPTSELADARLKPVEMIGVDGTRVPCKLEAFAVTKENEAEVLLEYLVPVA
jgi:hypothetical protein